MLLSIKTEKIWGESYIVAETKNYGLVKLLERVFKVKVIQKKSPRNLITFFVQRNSDLEKKLQNKAWLSAFKDKIREGLKRKKKFVLQPYRRKEKKWDTKHTGVKEIKQNT